jgi:hypothetical protein
MCGFHYAVALNIIEKSASKYEPRILSYISESRGDGQLVNATTEDIRHFCSHCQW